MVTRRSFALQALAGLAAGSRAFSAQWAANYDEQLVPPYTLPPLLHFDDGGEVRTVGDWQLRRTELLEAFASHVYGRTPDLPLAMRPRITPHEAGTPALGGRARRTQMSLDWPDDPAVPPVGVLLYQPARLDRPAPVVIGLNFFGNHAIHDDPAIPLNRRWMRASDAHGIRDHRATERSRGTTASRWPVADIIDAGCAVMTAYCGDLAPDDPAEVGGGVAPLFAAPVAAMPADERWGALGMWAWGLARMRDLVDGLPDLDASRVAVLGHSRLGKAALWAGAQDQRFAMVIANNSGCGGAALSRRAFGETVGLITRAFPHWFCSRFAEYAEREAALPVDQHQLLALVAPRALYVASAVDDLWADPRGEFLATAEVDPVYQLLGATGLGTRTMPPPDESAGQTVRYHVRTGGHDITMFDWQHYLQSIKDLLVA